MQPLLVTQELSGEASGNSNSRTLGRDMNSLLLATLRGQNEMVLEGLGKSVDRLISAARQKDDYVNKHCQQILVKD